ncbi:MAG TPA: DUF2171 domain-containing protein [Allosphingosinicella sp.]
MGNDDRFGDRDRGQWRGDNRGDWDRNRDNDRGSDRGFFERAGEEVRSWFGGDRDDDRNSYGRPNERDYDRGYGRDPQDRSPGAHTDYYRGGDRGQRRMGPEGGFESREDYRRSDQYADQGKSWGRGGGSARGGGSSEGGGGFSSGGGAGGVSQGMGSYGGNRDSGYGVGNDDAVGYSTGGSAGPGFDPNFSAGPRFDRQDVGSTGTHGAHPVASPYGEAQTGFGGGGFGGGGSARARAILQQHEQQHGGQSAGQGSSRQPEQGRQMGGFQSGQQHDPHYAEWRRRQVESLDRDYDEYRRENASRFESEFGSWREKRGQQRQSLGKARPQMEVVGSDGQHVGTVDKIAGDRIILTKSDANAGGHHHSIPCSWIDNVDDKVTIAKTAEQAMEAWRDEETSRALFEDRDSGSEGPHVLERSFSGTYSKDE